MELEVTSAFPTLIGRLQIPDADAMNRDLQALILAEEAKYSSLGRSNIGGWHSRPDFLVLVYGPGRATSGEQLKDFPPTFLVAAASDRGASNGSAQLFIELNHAGAVAELHLYQKGRHGFGAAYKDPEFSPWMPALRHFLQLDGFLPKGE